jgi:hypothetical protein
MLERLGDMIRSARTGQAPNKAKKVKPETAAAPIVKAEPTSETKVEEVDKASGGSPAETPGSSQDMVTDVVAKDADAQQPEPQEVDAPASDPAKTPATTEPESKATPEQDEKPQPVVPDGAFVVTADMMSIVGCSGEDFLGILRSLGYRQQTLPAPSDGADPIVIWRYQVKRDHGSRPRKDSDRPTSHRGSAKSGEARGPRHKGKSAKEGTDRGPRQKGRSGQKFGGAPKGGARGGPAGGRRPERKMDPDSPFAVLAALKSGGKE